VTNELQQFGSEVTETPGYSADATCPRQSTVLVFLTIGFCIQATHDGGDLFFDLGQVLAVLWYVGLALSSFRTLLRPPGLFEGLVQDLL
jgi:hypothetical protein